MSFAMPRVHQASTEELHQVTPYSGQWTKEEQDYVAILVEGFKNGSLDIPDGTSLRFFIAAKLGCKPKRVSKKYERTGYNGKQVYRRDTSLSTEDQEGYSKRLKDLEKKFKESRALILSMQEAKAADTTASARLQPHTQTTVPPAMSANAQALEERLVAMRSQLDRRAAAVFGLGQQQQQRSPLAGMLGPLSSPLAPSPLSPDVLEAYLHNRRSGMNTMMGGFGAFSTRQAAPAATPTATTNKLLFDLYQRRQQLVMANAVRTAGTAATADTSYLMDQGTIAGATSNAESNNKRTLGQDELALTDSVYKRARAA